MRTRALVLLAIAGSAALLAAGAATRTSAAAFTAGVTTGGNSLTVDRLGNHFAVTPGADATGDVDSLDVDLGLVATPGAVAGVFTVTNVSAASRTATLALLGPSQLASATFAASGGPSVTLAPGDSSAVTLTTSPTVAGRGAGAVRLGLQGSSWLYRDYPLALDAAPSAPGGLTAVAKPAGRIDLSWTASPTTTNLAGYEVYRSTGNSWTKLTPGPLAGTSYSDTSTTDGVLYTYAVRAVSTGVALESLDSPHATARADATAPTLPSAVQLVNGGGQGNQYLNLANSSSVSVSVTLPATSVASNVVEVVLTAGAQSVTATAPASAGAGTVMLTGIDASALADGTVTISATVADIAGNVSAQRTTSAPKDAAAPGAPSATYLDERNTTPDQILGTAEAGTLVTATQTVPSASGPYTTTASAGGAYTVHVAATKGTPGNPITVTYLVTATDAAGNPSAATTLTYLVTR